MQGRGIFKIPQICDNEITRNWRNAPDQDDISQIKEFLLYLHDYTIKFKSNKFIYACLKHIIRYLSKIMGAYNKAEMSEKAAVYIKRREIPDQQELYRVLNQLWKNNKIRIIEEHKKPTSLLFKEFKSKTFKSNIDEWVDSCQICYIMDFEDRRLRKKKWDACKRPSNAYEQCEIFTKKIFKGENNEI